jgi:hypothetical protein
MILPVKYLNGTAIKSNDSPIVGNSVSSLVSEPNELRNFGHFSNSTTGYRLRQIAVIDRIWPLPSGLHHDRRPKASRMPHPVQMVEHPWLGRNDL